MARWAGRGGQVFSGTLTAGGRKVRVKSPVWWIEYRDSKGKRCRVPGSRIRAAAEHKMAGIVQQVEREKGGLVARVTATDEALTSLAAEYRNHLADMGRSEKHYEQVYTQIIAVVGDCRWTRAADVTLSGWVRWVGVQRANGHGMAADTINHYLRSLRAFFRWLIRAGRLNANPLAAAELLNAEADRRQIRRTLPPEVFRLLIDTTRASRKKRVYLDGPGRAALYLIAARTGLRAGVLARLEKSGVRLEDTTPHIPTEARRQKSRKALAVPLSASLVDELRAWLESRPDGLLWPGNWHRHNKAASMLRRDLRAAGIPETTEDGTYDFHALRGQAATDLALAGVPLHVTQQFLGHSDPRLTSRFYIRLGLVDLAAAAAKVG